MSVKSNTDAILKDLGKYRDFLAGMNEEEFQRTPKEGVWSYSEVYSHILTSNTGSLVAIERCVHGNKSGTGRLGLVARLVLFFGMFPPGARLKAPEKVKAMVQKMSLEDARNGIIKFRERLLDQVSLVAKAPGDQKIRHPRLDMLNAKQWLRFIEIHTRHHLKQLKRIKALLAKNASKN